MSDDQRVVLVKEGRGWRQCIHEQRPPVSIAVARRNDAQPGEDADGVRVDHEAGVAGGIEHDVVGRLRADTVGGEQPRPQFVHW